MDLAVVGGLIGFLVFAFILTIALSRLVLAMADLADRIAASEKDEPPDG